MKKYLIILSLCLASVFAFNFSQDYFEISKNLDVFNTLYRELNIAYVDETKPGQLMKTGIEAMLASLDPYTNYYTENDIEDYRYMTTGEYGGIGALIQDVNKKITVTEPYDGFAAFNAGLRAGDEIVEVNGINVVGKRTEDITSLLKGQAGTPIKLKIIRLGETVPVEVNMKREEIKVKSVPYFSMLTNDIGYIKLTSFTDNCSGEVKDALLKLKEQNCKSLVLDLRGNPGGLLHEAVNIVNLFVDKNNEVVSTRGKVKDWNKQYFSLYAPVDTQMPLAVLVDNNSASASEIVSGALQDLDRAVIIGQRSYGKGLVQQTRDLTYNTKLKVTVAKYYIPSGRCIQALDYTHKDEEGRVEKVPDSLITAFKTKNGRIIYDGAGILPDFKTEPVKYSNILATLLNKNHIFTYVNQYLLTHPQFKTTAASVSLTESDYNEFINFLKDKDYNYKTQSDYALEELKDDASNEKYYESIKSEYEALVTKMAANKKDDLIRFKPEIKQFIEEELASRFEFQKGRIETALRYDKDVLEAKKMLGDKTRMTAILTTIEKPTKPFNPNKRF
ncbi:MAG: C-terminal processing peptidase [Bacteroidota bacterium]|jgi:carboxyl-terminal processing protease|nr:C-terminal processing peptidase [Bacteroidota bacterium]